MVVVHLSHRGRARELTLLRDQGRVLPDEERLGCVCLVSGFGLLTTALCSPFSSSLPIPVQDTVDASQTKKALRLWASFLCPRLIDLERAHTKEPLATSII